MIKVNIKKDVIEIKGHADFNTYGKDIVCSSVSSIVITTVNALLKLHSNITYESNEGYIKININEHNDITDILIGNMIDLLKELQNNYKKNIQINEEV